MKLKFIKYKNKDGEQLLAIHVFDEDGKEIDLFQFYNNKEETEKEPLLIKSIEELPSLIKLISKVPEIFFEEEEILM
jgi:hypothetical protein